MSKNINTGLNIIGLTGDTNSLYVDNGNFTVTSGGTIGINTSAPTSILDINGVTGSTQLRLRQSYTPSSSGDTAGNVGDVAWDDDYFYLKTNSGWGRTILDYTF